MLLEALARGFVAYQTHVPMHRGKARLTALVSDAVGTVALRSPAGITLEVFLGSSMDMTYFRSESARGDENVVRALQMLEPGDVFIDVGANIGFYSLLASSKVGEHGRVYAFEPSRREFRRLLRNLTLNGANNIVPYSLALSDREDSLLLAVTRASHTGINRLTERKSDDLPTQLVAAARGDTLLSHLTTETRLGIKIDVEGAELLALRGLRSVLTRCDIRFLVVEITPRFLASFGHTKEQLLTFVREIGLRPTVASDAWQYDELFVPDRDSPRHVPLGS